MDHKITTQEAGSDVVTEIERVIVRRESRQDGKELFIFADGGVVYFEDGKVFEMGSNGGVNIIPVDSAGAPPPVVYRSQGMQIEKWVGAVDTSLVVEGRHFDDCLEVITRFRTLEGEGPKGTVSYSTSSHTLRTSDAAWIRSRRSGYRPRRRYAQLAWDSQNNLDDTAYKAGFNALGGLDVLPERHELE
jgi:hypothetical protein